MTWDVALSTFSGLRFFASELDAATVLRTVFVMHTCDAAMCGVIARNNGHSRSLWTALGFLFGVWAVAVVIVLPKKM